MKIVLLYLRVISRADPSLPVEFPYEVGERRFLETYKQFRPSTPHDLLVVNCGKHAEWEPFDDVVTHYAYYDGLGSDCGTYQAITHNLDCDFVLCFNTLAYFWKPNWLEPFLAAVEKYGNGVYGPTASYENWPHLRTPCIGFHPSVMRDYPGRVNSRSDAIEFESGEHNLSRWATSQGLSVMMVTEQECFRWTAWRKPANIFRRGDQSNCLVWDRHTLVYAEAGNEEKRKLETLADTNIHHV